MGYLSVTHFIVDRLQNQALIFFPSRIANCPQAASMSFVKLKTEL